MSGYFEYRLFGRLSPAGQTKDMALGTVTPSKVTTPAFNSCLSSQFALGILGEGGYPRLYKLQFHIYLNQLTTFILFAQAFACFQVGCLNSACQNNVHSQNNCGPSSTIEQYRYVIALTKLPSLEPWQQSTVKPERERNWGLLQGSVAAVFLMTYSITLVLEQWNYGYNWYHHGAAKILPHNVFIHHGILAIIITAPTSIAK